MNISGAAVCNADNDVDWKLIIGRTLVPIRNIAEVLGAEVQ